MNDVLLIPVPDIAVVIPVCDEKESLTELHEKLTAAMAAIGRPYEVIFVDDGSADDSARVCREIASADRRVTAVELRRNFGKAVALQIGFQLARGAIIITMDGDLQDDPLEIPHLLAALEGADVVSGWKQERQDPLDKTLPSRFFNWVTATLTRVPLRDFNCGFKAYRREVVQSLDLYGELHRYIPVLAYAKGFRVAEVPVHHLPRLHGRSKYGRERLLRGAFDLMTVLLLSVYRYRPLHLFGLVGLASSAAGVLIDLYLSVLWFLGGGPIGNRPLLTLGSLLIILGIQILMFGLLAEMITAATYRRGDVMALIRAISRGGAADTVPTASPAPDGAHDLG